MYFKAFPPFVIYPLSRFPQGGKVAPLPLWEKDGKRVRDAYILFS